MDYAWPMRVVIFLLLSILAGAAAAGVIEGQVIEVPDGDTVTVLARGGTSLHKVRLAGIDAPALSRPYGGSSRESLKRLLRGKTVRVETTAIDQKGRLVGVVAILQDLQKCAETPCDERLDPGLAQLNAGMATLNKINLAYQTEDAQRLYAAAEAHARAQSLGLWRVPRAERFAVRAAVH